jgi:hypothetical protein
VQQDECQGKALCSERPEVGEPAIVPGANVILYFILDPLCLSSSCSTLHFSDYYFHVPYPVNRDDRHLLAKAMASDFTVAPGVMIFCDFRQFCIKNWRFLKNS